MSNVRGPGMSGEYLIQGRVKPLDPAPRLDLPSGTANAVPSGAVVGAGECLSPPALARLSDDLLGAASEGADQARPRARRRAQGAYFTPAPLVDLVVREALAARLARRPPAWRDDGSPELLVLDPAAGDGRFLAAAATLLAEQAARRGFEIEAAAAAIVRRCLVGIERDPEFAALARARLSAVAGEGATVHCAEALLSPIAAELTGAADVVVGNPPYLRSIRLGLADDRLRQALRGRYAATSRGEWDLYAAFLEQSLEWTADGGEVALVVPSRWLTARCAALLRAKLAAARAVRALILFGAEQIFPGATTYASVAFLSRAPNRRVVVARRTASAWQVGHVPAGELDGAPWCLSIGRRRALVERLAGQGPALSQVARVAKGAGTNADPIFVLAPAAAREVESALVRPCLRGRDVEAFGAGRPARVLVPYARDGRFIEPDELRRRYPRAAAYLASHRGALERRERGRFRGPEFYRFGRPQNLAWLSVPEPKLVVPDVARAGRALIDRRAAMVLDSAYAIRPLGAEVSLGLLLAVFNSKMVALWLRETGVPLRGGYMRLKTAYLDPLPLPPPSRQRAAAERAALSPDAARRREEIDDLVRRAYGIDRADWCDGDG
jgi:N-6 DNA Methylase/TaqI-like C-terminal specificity domain